MDILDLTDGECHCGQLCFLYRDFFFFSVMGSKKMGKGSFILALGHKEGVLQDGNLKQQQTKKLACIQLLKESISPFDDVWNWSFNDLFS